METGEILNINDNKKNTLIENKDLFPKILDSYLKEKEKIEGESEELDGRSLAFNKEHVNLIEEPFDPKDQLAEILLSIKSSPRENQSNLRRKKISEFKENLRIQRIGIAYLQIRIEEMIKDNPNIPARDLISEIREKGRIYGLTQEQLNLFYKAITKYIVNHRVINNVLGKFKSKYEDRWQEELFRELFGRLPEGKIEIEVRPMSFHIKAHNLEDYALMYNGGDISKAKITNGAKLGQGFEILGGRALITIENVFYKNPADKGVKIHEEEHLIHDLYPPSVFVAAESELIKFSDSGIDEIVKGIKKSLLITQKFYKSFAKSEILSYLKNGKDPNFIKEILLNSEVYDYFHILEEEKRIERWVGNILEEHPQKEEIIEISKKLAVQLWEKDYKNSVSMAIDAADKLLEIYPQYRLLILRLLSIEPLDKWHRLIKIFSK